MENKAKKRKASHWKIQPQWLKCPRVGSTVAGKFIPFKTPLSECYDDLIPEGAHFTPSMLLSSLDHKVRVGLWIDLTDVRKFYDYRDVESRVIKYKKIPCRDRDNSCPSSDQIGTFIEMTERFVSEHPEEIVAVHCTLGFNRSGFLIVAYLVEKMQFLIEDAVACFAISRPPGIYLSEYLEELFRRYGRPDDVPPAVPVPDWCGGPDDAVKVETEIEEGEMDGYEGLPRKKEKRNVGEIPVFMAGVPGVTNVVDEPKLSLILRKCQVLCKWTGSGFPGTQPVRMDSENVKLLRQRQYKVSWRSRSTRYMMLIHRKDDVYFIDRNNAVFQVSGVQFPRHHQPDEHLFDTLLDGEMVLDKVNGINVPRYLVFDIVSFEGWDISQSDSDKRYLCIQEEVIEPRIKAMVEGMIVRSREPFGIRIKCFFDVRSAEFLLSDEFLNEVTHSVDGLLFKPVEHPYVCGRNPDVLKWKPPGKNCLDFRLVIKREIGECLLPVRKGFLYVEGLDRPFSEIRLTKNLMKMRRKIIKCKYESNGWGFVRERRDMSFPSSYDTAIAVCKSPLTEDKLCIEIEYLSWKPPYWV